MIIGCKVYTSMSNTKSKNKHMLAGIGASLINPIVPSLCMLAGITCSCAVRMANLQAQVYPKKGVFINVGEIGLSSFINN